MSPQTVLITGCSSGIGEATARAFLAAGHRVYATARDVGSLQGLQAAGAQVARLDVLDEASMVQVVERIKAEAGGIDILINNAGYSESGAIEELPMAAIRRQFETNVFGLIRLTQLVLPGMRQRRAGRILNISSVGGKITLPLLGIYNASKYALESVSDALRMEVADFGIDVVLIEPGGVATRFTDTAKHTLGNNVSPKSSPYRPWHVTALQAMDDPAMARTYATPDQAAQVLLRAAVAPRPRTRYVITTAAKVLLRLKAWLPDRWFDGIIRRNLPGSPDRTWTDPNPIVATTQR